MSQPARGSHAATPVDPNGPQDSAVMPSLSQWEEIEANPEFQQLISAKKRFIIPATIFFIVYYFALPVLVGYFPEFMETKVIGKINIAYIFALSQFFMAWIIAFLYVRKAGQFDEMAARITDHLKGAAE